MGLGLENAILDFNKLSEKEAYRRVYGMAGAFDFLLKTSDLSPSRKEQVLVGILRAEEPPETPETPEELRSLLTIVKN